MKYSSKVDLKVVRWWVVVISYMRNEDVVPSLATEEVADDELEDVKRDVGYNAVYPDHTSPSPSDSTDPCKTPVCVDSKYSGNLQRQFINHN